MGKIENEAPVSSDRLNVFRSQMFHFWDERKNGASDHPSESESESKEIRKNTPEGHPFQFQSLLLLDIDGFTGGAGPKPVRKYVHKVSI